MNRGSCLARRLRQRVHFPTIEGGSILMCAERHRLHHPPDRHTHLTFDTTAWQDHTRVRPVSLSISSFRLLHRVLSSTTELSIRQSRTYCVRITRDLLHPSRSTFLVPPRSELGPPLHHTHPDSQHLRGNLRLYKAYLWDFRCFFQFR